MFLWKYANVHRWRNIFCNDIFIFCSWFAGSADAHIREIHDRHESGVQLAIWSSSFRKLMTASTSAAATQTAAAPSSREHRNMTFHLIKSCKNSDQPAWPEQAVLRVEHRSSGMWCFCRRHCHIEIIELAFAQFESQERKIAWMCSFFFFFCRTFQDFNHRLPIVQVHQTHRYQTWKVLIWFSWCSRVHNIKLFIHVQVNV